MANEEAVTITDLDDLLQVRVNGESYEKFKTNARVQMSKTHTVFIREIIDAFNDNRLRIIPKESEVYVNRKEH